MVVGLTPTSVDISFMGVGLKGGTRNAETRNEEMSETGNVEMEMSPFAWQ